MSDPADDPVLQRLIALQERIESLAQLTEELARLFEQYIAATRAMQAGEAPPPRVN
jgi:hypothetical protein